MSRVYNFSPGPAMLPEPVLEEIRDELLDWHHTGMAAMELPHRGDDFLEIAHESEQVLRELLNISNDYEILFLQGGGRSQFAMVPMNFIREKGKAVYANTGQWSSFAMKEAELYGKVILATDSESNRFTTIAPNEKWNIPNDAAYLHYVDNETVNGVEFPYIPDSKGLPLISDMSSNILSRPFDLNRFSLIYATAQKNVGVAGVTLVILHKDMLNREPLDATPSMFRYHLHVRDHSMHNTPPTFSWYVAGKVFNWIKKQGGLEKMALLNNEKANILYNFIDDSDFYKNPIDPIYRSRMNVVFTLADDNLNQLFLDESREAGLTNLKGHRFVGGMRASIYNAMPKKGVEKLVAFMDDFAKRNG